MGSYAYWREVSKPQQSIRQKNWFTNDKEENTNKR